MCDVFYVGRLNGCLSNFEQACSALMYVKISIHIIKRMWVAVKTQLLEWVVGPTPGIALTQSSYMQGILVLIRVKGYLQTHM